MHAGMVLAVACCLGQVPQEPDRGANATGSVEVRYAQAQLHLAEANLKRVEQMNQSSANTVPSSVVADYRHEVQVAQARLEQATKGTAATAFQVWLERADAERRSAETNWRNATAVNRRIPGTYKPLDLERLRLRAQVAALQLERGQALASAGREAQLQWQVDLLDNQVQRLKEESGRPAPYVRYYPLWHW
jgi:hypothetical protein